GAGYNTLRFDDEMTRYSLYRNFFDPYGREWQGGNSRWDLIDVVRTAYALRPEGIVWPEEEGRVTLKLERLTAANGIDHGQAHDALSDVRATIALARLIRDKQPKLYDYLFQLRSKHKRLYTRREDLVEGQLPVPLKLLHINKCPVVAPLSVLREEDRQRLQLDMSVFKERVLRLNEGQAIWQEKLKTVYASDEFT
nr:hypothetical protein [Tanacetum cinerariifolium]